MHVQELAPSSPPALDRRSPPTAVNQSGLWRLLAASCGALALTALWFLWLFSDLVPPEALILDYSTKVVAVGVGVSALLWVLRVSCAPTTGCQLAVLGVILLLFGIPLSGMWSGGPSGPCIHLGLFPYSDAAGYESGALTLLHRGKLEAFSTRRPLMAAVLGAVFSATGGGLQVAQALLVYASAISVFCVALVLWESHGLPAAVLGVVSLFAFCSSFLGSLLSENLSLPLGATAFALLWSGLPSWRPWVIALGLFAMALAQNARPGSLLALPLLVVWLAWRSTSRGGRGHWLRTLLCTAVATGAGFMPSILLGTAYGGNEGLAFGNFSLSLYRLVVGSSSWKQAYVDHPHIEGMPEAERYRWVYEVALREARHNPDLVLLGTTRAYGDFFGGGSIGFVDDRRLRALFLMLAAVGIADCVRRRREPRAQFLLVAAVGTVASVPFIADGGPRVHAATISATVGLIAVGADALARWSNRSVAVAAPRPGSLLPSGLLLLTLTLLSGPVVPLYAGRGSSAGRLQELACPTGEAAVVAELRPGSWVFVRLAGARRLRLPEVGWWEFEQEFAKAHDLEVTPPLLTARAFDRVSGLLAWIVVEEAGPPRDLSPLHLCGEWRSPRIFVGRMATRDASGAGGLTHQTNRGVG